MKTNWLQLIIEILFIAAWVTGMVAVFHMMIAYNPNKFDLIMGTVLLTFNVASLLQPLWDYYKATKRAKKLNDKE